MKYIKNKERVLAGNLYCSFCRPLKIHAIYRKNGFTDHKRGLSCEEHKHLIEEDIIEDDYSEADYQTWLNL